MGPQPTRRGAAPYGALCGALGVALLCVLLCANAAAQVSLGIQAPLAAFAALGWGPLELSVGMPLVFEPAFLSTFAEARWRWAPIELPDRSLRPFLAAGAGVPWADPATWAGWLGAGVEVHVPGSALSTFGQLRWTPAAQRGLYEALTLGVRVRF